jgi:hypothetical protein
MEKAMVDLAPAVAGITYLRDFMKYVTGLRRDADVLERVNEALEKVGAVQDKLQELRDHNIRLLEENRELKLDIQDAEEWKARLAAYTLVKTPGGAIVLSSNAPTPHYACPGCAERDEELHPLQGLNVYAGLYKCPNCKEQYPIEQPPGPGAQGRIRSSWP